MATGHIDPTKPVVWPKEVDLGPEFCFPDLKAARRCTNSYESGTSIGVDWLHPRHFGLLSDASLEAFLMFIRAIVFCGMVPEQIDVLLISLIPKPEGGTRPIGVFPSTIRFASRLCRSSYGETWLDSHKRNYHFGRRGKSSLKCAWRMAALSEYAFFTKQCVNLTLYDIVKAFEHVSHDFLIQQAIEYDFDLSLLRWILALYRMERRIIVDGVCTAAVRARRSIVPGDSFADILMFLSLIGAADTVAHRYPHAYIGMVVDDLQVLNLGSLEHVKQEAVNIARDFLQLLEVGCFLPVSTKKLVFVTRNNEVRRFMARKVGRLKNASRRTARNLGVDFSAGSIVQPHVQNRRCAAAKVAARRMQRLRLGFKASAHIVNSGFKPRACYGAQVNGISKSNVRSLRRLFHTTVFRKAKTRSCTVDLEFVKKGFDPQYPAIWLPISSFHCALWDSLLPRHVLLRLFSAAWREVCTGKVAVRGPATACASALKQIGWTVTALNKWRSREGVVNDIDVVCPRSLEHQIHHDTKFLLWSRVGCHTPCRSGTYSQLVGRPWTEPLARCLNAKSRPEWDDKAKGLCRAILAEGIWPLWRLRLAGYSTDGLCVCGDRHTLFHIIWECPLTRTFRDSYGLDQDIFELLASSPHLSLWHNGLVADPCAVLPPPISILQPKWIVHPEDGPCFSLHGFGDGSGRRTQLDVTRRCGWAVVSAKLGDDGIIERRSEAYGPLPLCYQHVHTAELFALLFYLRHAVAQEGVYRFHSDCAYVVDRFACGREANTHGWAVDADLWSQVFAAVDDVGCELCSVAKLAAHRKVESAEDALDKMQIIANNRADALAKLGVDLHPDDSNSRGACVADAKKVVQVVKFMTRCLSYAIDNKVYKDVQNERLSIIEKATFKYDPDSLASRHFFTFVLEGASSYRCVKCFAVSSKASRLGRCSGDCWARGHRLSSVGHNIIFCIRCGAYSIGRVNLLGNSCHGCAFSIATKRAKERLLCGLHPTTKVFISPPKPLTRYFRRPPGGSSIEDDTGFAEAPDEGIDVILD